MPRVSGPPAPPPTRSLPGWWHRWRSLVGEAWRFGVVGATNVLINFVVFNALALTLFPGGELKANIVATAFATTTSYLMNRGWTFRHRKTSRVTREYVLFFVFNAAGLAIELAVMGAAKYGLGLAGLWALNLAKMAGLGLGTVFRFWTYRTFVFAGRPAPAADTPGTDTPGTDTPGTDVPGTDLPGAQPALATVVPAVEPGMGAEAAGRRPAGRPARLATAPAGQPPGP